MNALVRDYNRHHRSNQAHVVHLTSASTCRAALFCCLMLFGCSVWGPIYLTAVIRVVHVSPILHCLCEGRKGTCHKEWIDFLLRQSLLLTPNTSLDVLVEMKSASDQSPRTYPRDPVPESPSNLTPTMVYGIGIRRQTLKRYTVS